MHAVTAIPPTSSTANGVGPLPHEIVWNLTNGIIGSRAIHVIAELGVGDQIGDEPVSVEKLASACSAHPEALDRVLQLLAAHGVFERRTDGYSHTDASRLLRSDHPMSMRAFARMNELPVFLATFDQLDYSVRTGVPAIEKVKSGGLWPYLQEHPREREIFGQAMTAKAAADTAAVLRSYDFSRFDTIADIGGGRGHLLRAVLDAVPSAEGILFDLPPVIEALEVDRERLTPRAGDFFVDALPSADAYILMEVIHDWADAEARAILSAIRRASSPGARVLIIENVLDDTRPDPRGRTLDIIMLTVTGGRERTGGELGELLRRSGFSNARVIDTGGPMRIVEAVAT
ncbi:MAG TPA: methyltransferase [Candidatus Sulfotelmatobacter sp.]|nr:methyltransferase [Candidatus Sulfotelmatobacter sp.]